MKRITFPISLVGEKCAGTYVKAAEAYEKIHQLELELEEALNTILENKLNE